MFSSMKLAFAALFLAVGGCAALKSHSGGSGTTIDAPFFKIVEALNRRMTLREYQIRPAVSEEVKQTVYLKPTGSITVGNMYNSGPSRSSESFQEVTCTFSNSPHGVRVLISSRQIENLGGVNETYSRENSYEVLRQMEIILDDVRKELAEKH